MHALENIHPLNGKEISSIVFFSSVVWLFIQCDFLFAAKFFIRYVIFHLPCNFSSTVWFFICYAIFHPLWMKLNFGQNSFNSGLISFKILIIFEFRLRIWTFKMLFHLEGKKKFVTKFFTKLVAPWDNVHILTSPNGVFIILNLEVIVFVWWFY